MKRFKAAVAASKETGVMVVVDTIGVKQQAARARQCADWGVHMIYLHYGADQRAADASQDSAQWLDEVLAAVSIPVGVGMFRRRRRGARRVERSRPRRDRPSGHQRRQCCSKNSAISFAKCGPIIDPGAKRLVRERHCRRSFKWSHRHRGQFSLLLQHEHDPRAEAVAGGRDRYRRPGRLPGDRTVDQRDRSICRARRLAARPEEANQRLAD